MAQLPEVDTWLPGASCLLCYAAAAAANNKLSAHLQQLNADDLTVVANEVEAIFKAKGTKTLFINEVINLDDLKKVQNKRA